MKAPGDLVAIWLATRLTVRVGGRTLDLDAPAGSGWAAAIAPLVTPLTLVTAWNPRGRAAGRAANRTANRALRRSIEARGWAWRPALGSARDGSWAEPGFAVGGLDEVEAARLAAEWDQLAAYLIDEQEVAVLASDRSYRFARARGGAGDGLPPPPARQARGVPRPSEASTGVIRRAAPARCEIAFFSSADQRPSVRPPGGSDAGSKSGS